MIYNKTMHYRTVANRAEAGKVTIFVFLTWKSSEQI